MKQSWHQFAPPAQRAIRMFNLILDAHGWEDVEQTEYRLDHGCAVYPHATRSSYNSTCELEATMHTQVNMVSLSLTPFASHQPSIRLHFLYKEDPVSILEQMIAAQSWLQPGLYFRFAMQLRYICEDVLVETPNREIRTLSS